MDCAIIALAFPLSGRGFEMRCRQLKTLCLELKKAQQFTQSINLLAHLPKSSNGDWQSPRQIRMPCCQQMSACRDSFGLC